MSLKGRDVSLEAVPSASGSCRPRPAKTGQDRSTDCWFALAVSGHSKNVSQEFPDRAHFIAGLTSPPTLDRPDISIAGMSHHFDGVLTS